MRISRILTIHALIVMSVLSPWGAKAGEQAGPAKDVVSFKWAFLLRDENSSARAVDFKDRVAVRKGDALQVYLEPVTNAYLYLFLFDAQKQVRCLFPPAPTLYENGERPSGSHLLPGDGKWFVMDEHTGTERFYLLASTKRLTEIEALTRQMIASPDDAEVKARLLDEIRSVRRAKSDFTAPVEKSVPIAGTVVAVTRGPAVEAILTEATGFYARTLRIEHE